MRYLVILAVACAIAVAGCALSAEERRDIVDQSAAAAGALAEKATRAALEKGMELALKKIDDAIAGLAAKGASADELARLQEERKRVEATMRAETDRLAAIAREEAEKRAREIAERAVPRAEDAKSAKTGAVFASVFNALLTIGVGMLKPGGAA